MNSKQSKVLIRQYTRNDYETRFLLQSKNHSPNRINTQVNSRVVQWLGGEESFDFLSIYFAGLVADDDVLAKVYSGLNAKALVKMQKELLWLVLDDGLQELVSSSTSGSTRQAACKRTILQNHVRLGLMERDEYFDRLFYHLTYALAACQITTNESTIFNIQHRFAAIRPLLLEMMITQHDYQEQQQQQQHVLEGIQTKRMKSNRFPSLGKLFGSNKKSKVQCLEELQPGTCCPAVTATA
ncbi:unnamed protein product [Cylindrotheca closterium]|uniref:Uncharacterized protein n=1 Tax=Cylindrotheca closterium TaxID=2856 RepID=A0AAD2G997_9STRA|nr:unnamed protein product [Cylindrotheca closterium]